MEMGEGTASADIPEEPKKDVEKIRIRFCVFFDGTLNNRTNIDQRLVSEPDEKLTAQERKDARELKKKTSAADQKKAAVLYKQHGAKKDDEENSYEGYYTNVVIMERYVDKMPKYDLTLKTYIEGAGSLDKEGDKTLGYAFAQSESGIPNKVKKGVLDVVTKISQQNPDKEVIIEKLTLDVFGFSRGAAAARNFIHEALHGADSVATQLSAQGFQVVKTKVCFVGLYDTVSTYGVIKVALGVPNNTKGLKLDAIAHAEQVIHLTAADEHRKHFTLTNINSAGGKGKEFFLPGVHSDIGGGYRDDATEKQVIFEGYGYSLGDAKRERTELIAAGWYKENEITLEHTEGYEGNESDEFTILDVLRNGIHNHYSHIPLHLMAGYARENKINLNGKLERDEDIPSALGAVKQKIDDYIASTTKSEATHWHHNVPWLCQLRHDYFHFSARYKIGHTPRYSRGRRYRKTYNG